MDQGGAFGSPGATGDFNVKTFLTKPEVILRITGWVFSVVVFGCITDQGYTVDQQCVYNGNQDACRFGNAVGIIAFLAIMAFLVSDAMFDNIANVMHRKFVVMADVGFSALWMFMWFVCFCFLADAWRKTTTKVHKSASEAAIAFSFFSIAVFAALTVLAVRRYRQGITTDFHSGYDPNIFGEGDRSRAPYSGPSDAYQGGDYRESPFADPQTSSKSDAGGYQAQGSY